ncbi:hypothetical protein JTB14_038435 [Gonioctena quinquepunctata]|nr:hypothetical protein JTB14_038435 [Gonioctena quinquepunctata]
MVSDVHIVQWVRNSLRKEELREIDVEIEGHSDAEGFLSHIILVKACCITKKNKQKTYNLAVKYMKEHEGLRKLSCVQQACKIEFYMYSRVFPALKNFLHERKIQDELHSIAKCYACIDCGHEEVIIMDNLKANGYEMNDKKEPLNVHNLKAVLKEYGEFHALSFALKDQKKELYKELIQHLHHDIFISTMNLTQMRESFEKNLRTALMTLKLNGDISLHDKLYKLFSKPPHEMMIDAISNIEELQSVIVHGDCWNNNYFYKYQEDDQTVPVAVKIIDWQMSGIRSPVFDLAHFIYCSGCNEAFEEFDEVLICYYQSFSSFLQQLGSDPQELFTFSDLKRHWKKYAIVGLIMSLNVLKIMLSDETAVIPDDGDDSENAAWFDLPLPDMKIYYPRLRAIVSHYFSVIE